MCLNTTTNFNVFDTLMKRFNGGKTITDSFAQLVSQRSMIGNMLRTGQCIENLFGQVIVT